MHPFPAIKVKTVRTSKFLFVVIYNKFEFNPTRLWQYPQGRYFLYLPCKLLIIVAQDKKEQDNRHQFYR